MFTKHIKLGCFIIITCLLLVMFFTVAILNGLSYEVANSVGAVILLVLVVSAIVPVFMAHEKHN